MESVSSIIKDTGLSANDIDYIKQQFIPPDTGGGKRGVRQSWTKESKVEFAIVKRFMDYGITIKKIADIIDSLRKTDEWQNLFDSGSLKPDAIRDKTHSYIYLYDADPGRIRLMLNKTKQIFGLGHDWHDVLIIDITDLLLLALPGK